MPFLSMIAVSVQIFSALGQFLLVVAIAFILIGLLASYLRFENLTRPEGAPGAAESFELGIAQRLTRRPGGIAPFLVGLLQPVGSASTFEARHDELAGFVSARLRRTDGVAKVQQEQLGLRLESTRDRADKICSRLLEELAAFGEGPARAGLGTASYRLGIASYPENGARVKDLLQAASEALQTGLADSGSRWILCEAPSSSSPETAAAPDRIPSDLLDEETQVLSAGRLVPSLQKFIARFRKANQPVSVICLNVIPVPRVHERPGPDIGKVLYRGAADILKHNLREEDLIARHPEAGFVVGLACAGREALAAGRRVGELIRKSVFDAGPARWKVTVCGGVAGFPDQGTVPAEILDAARTACRAAQSREPNTWLVYNDSLRAESSRENAVDTL